MHVPSEFCQILAVCISCGVIGGIRNFILDRRKPDYTSSYLPQRLIEGVAAALAVPLFLSAIGNNILTDIFSEVDANTTFLGYLKLVGFSIIAALYSNRFLDGVSAKLLSLENEILVEKKATSEIRAQLVETAKDVKTLDRIVMPDGDVTKANPPEVEISDDAKEILQQFTGSPLLARTIEGLALSAKISPEGTKKALEELKTSGLAQMIETKRGPRWSLTESGATSTLR